MTITEAVPEGRDPGGPDIDNPAPRETSEPGSEIVESGAADAEELEVGETERDGGPADSTGRDGSELDQTGR